MLMALSTNGVSRRRLLSPRPAADVKGAGAVKLSPRQKQVHGLLLLGKATGEIARGLGLSRPTAANHISRVYRKFGVKSKYELLSWHLAQATAANSSSKRAA
jgi:DNA-binding CsgD family transcriptional regulator